MGLLNWLGVGKKEVVVGYQPAKTTTGEVNPPPKDPNTAGGLPEVKDVPPMPPVKKPRKPRKPKATAESYAKEASPPANTAKEIATLKGEPWVNVMGMEIDMDNVSNGSFELDWNEIFVAKLVRAGYAGKTDADIVDQWFRNICQNIVLELYEQSMADPTNRTA
jgi:hypothetical protein